MLKFYPFPGNLFDQHCPTRPLNERDSAMALSSGQNCAPNGIVELDSNMLCHWTAGRRCWKEKPCWAGRHASPTQPPSSIRSPLQTHHLKEVKLHIHVHNICRRLSCSELFLRKHGWLDHVCAHKSETELSKAADGPTSAQTSPPALARAQHTEDHMLGVCLSSTKRMQSGH